MPLLSPVHSLVYLFRYDDEMNPSPTNIMDVPDKSLAVTDKMDTSPKSASDETSEKNSFDTPDIRNVVLIAEVVKETKASPDAVEKSLDEDTFNVHDDHEEK